MTHSMPPQHLRRIAAIATAALAASLAAVPGATPASAGHYDGEYTTNCPAAESLVTGTPWHTHKLGSGLTLKEGQHSDSRGYVRLHVLTADTTDRHLTFGPLVRKLAMRSRLTSLASGHPHLLAATNTGFFDFQYGTPLGPVLTHGHLMIGSSHPASVVGFGTNGLVQAGHLALAGTVTSAAGTRPLVGLNMLYPGQGISAYTARWGSERVHVPRDAAARYVDKGVVTSGTGNFDGAPHSGYLLVARGQTSINWLKGVSRGGAATVSIGVTSDTARAFKLAYNVGEQIVGANGTALTGLKCRRRYPQPARTAIGFADHGRRLILALAEDRPGTALHGLDANQMARVMANLGAKPAYLFDGSGSTELLARFPSHPNRLSLRTYTADGQEREMPVGFGIFRR